MRKIGISSGDPAGIGPEITAKALRFLDLPDNFIIIVYGRLITFVDGNKIDKIDNVNQAVSPGIIYWIEIDDPKVIAGKPSSTSGEIAYRILERCAVDLNLQNLDAIVTCPVSKEKIHHTHPEFIGHTEFFAAKSNTRNVIMSFWGEHFHLALLTTHLPVQNVSKVLTDEVIEFKLRLIYREANRILLQPKLAMLAMNPHAGENTAFGFEDERVKAILRKLASENIVIDGPFPSDTFFATKAKQYNLIISAYHDQGLIPFKMISAEEGVNVTLGLPYVRTSVDHGTAFDIAGQGKASEKSLLSAIRFAQKMFSPNLNKKNGNYNTFAKYYDQYMSHVNYEDWVKYILNQFNKRFNKNPKRVLELACGTANISCQMVKKNLQVDASDVSEDMLKIAAEKPFCPNLFHHDMTSLLPADKYELVVLLFDSINYLMEDHEILKLLNNVYNTIADNGMFIFDITTPKNCEQNFDGFVNLQDNQDEYLIHQSDFDSDNLIQKTQLTFFIKKGFQYTRSDEIHEQRIYPVSEIVELIGKTNFKLKKINSIGFNDNLLNSDIDTLDKNFSRLFFVLEK